MTNIVSSHFSIGEKLDVETPNLALKVSKQKASDIISEIKIQNAKIVLPSFCDLTTKKSQSPTTTTKKTFGYNPLDDNNCTNKVITSQVNIKIQ